MGVRNRASNSGTYQKRFLTGPDDLIKKRDGATLSFVLHVRARSGPTENPFAPCVFHQFRAVVDTDDGLGFRLYTSLSPETDSSVLWSSAKGRIDNDGRMYDERRDGSRIYIEPQYDPMIRLQVRVWQLVQSRQISPDRVILRVPNHRLFRDRADVDAAVARMKNPDDLQDVLDDVEFDRRTWWEWRAAPSCGLDVAARKVNQYTQKLGLTPDTWRAAVMAVQGEPDVGVGVLPYSVFKGVCEAEMERIAFLKNRRGMVEADADRAADIHANRRLVIVQFRDKVFDPKTGRERRPQGSEYYSVMVDWDMDAPDDLCALADKPDYPDLDEALRANQRDYDRAWEAIGDMLRWARFEDCVDMDDLFGPWRKLLKSRGNEHDAPREKTSRHDTPAPSVSTASSGNAALESEVARLRRPRRAGGFDGTMGGRFGDVSRDDLLLCDPNPEILPGDDPDDVPSGCGLHLHPDWRSCPLCQLVYVVHGDPDFDQTADPPTMAEVASARWPSQEKCLACAWPVSVHAASCSHCHMDLARDVVAGAVVTENAAPSAERAYDDQAAVAREMNEAAGDFPTFGDDDEDDLAW